MHRAFSNFLENWSYVWRNWKDKWVWQTKKEVSLFYVVGSSIIILKELKSSTKDVVTFSKIVTILPTIMNYKDQSISVYYLYNFEMFCNSFIINRYQDQQSTHLFLCSPNLDFSFSVDTTPIFSSKSKNHNARPESQIFHFLLHLASTKKNWSIWKMLLYCTHYRMHELNKLTHLPI